MTFKDFKVKMTSDNSFLVISYATLTKMRTRHQPRDVVNKTHVWQYQEEEDNKSIRVHWCLCLTRIPICLTTGTHLICIYFSFLLNVVLMVTLFSRLQRVRQRQEHGRSESETTLQNDHVTLFEDYAVLDRDNKTFRIGNLVRLICAGNRNASLEYQRPVPYSDPKRQSITAYLQLYDPVQGPAGEEQRGVFELKTSEPCKFPFVDLLTHVNVSIRADNLYEIPSEKLASVENEANGLLQPPPRRGSRAATQLPNDDGIIRLTVEATETADSNGLRRSSRTRTAVIFNS